MAFIFPPPAVYSLAVASEEARFPINRIFCIGRNYAEHAREMGKDPERDPPFFFMKPANAIVQAGKGEISIPYPSKTQNFHYEVELVVAIRKGGSDIDSADANEHVFGYAVGLDMTRRDLQLEAREKGRPWEFGKSFSKSAPIGPIHRAEGRPIDDASIKLAVNGQVKQLSNVSQLIWSVAESIAHLSQFDALEPGDLIMTGTPAGVGPVVRGDLMTAAIEKLGQIQVRVDD
ncbi:fumarylacetoacetate hydrolase family protein [Caballeronia sp. J97]|uniref:fumarylacetoacetate hydrolase family protein n=1 Tax=Caballeronia sp. J97 TaxID=2805429 RepID=UPI002AAF79CC|nr:fumarylacetoacetate hydrolase family protein [Caballeronia sp. J97]